MTRVRVLQHEALEGPGYLGELLEAQGMELDIVRLDRGAKLPAGVDDVAGLVALGGRSDPHAHWPWVHEETALLARAAERDLPILAHGLGAELLARALGAAVRPNLVEQIGWFPVDRLEDEAGPDWLDAAPARCHVFKWHRQSFELPSEARRLFKSAWCPNEAFVLGNAMAWQGHLELTPSMLRQWVKAYADEIGQPSAEPDPASKLTLNWERIVQGPEQMLLDLPARIGALHQVAEAIYGGWMTRIRERAG